MRTFVIFLLTLLALAACTPADSAPPPTATPPAAFVSAVNDFLAAGSKLNAATAQGVSFLDYRDYYAEAGGAFDLANASWPEGFAPDAKIEVIQAMLGWELAGHMWDAKLDDKLTLIADPLQDEFLDYGGDAIRTLNYGDGPTVQVSDANIGALLSLASEHFETGRDLLLPLMP